MAHLDNTRTTAAPAGAPSFFWSLKTAWAQYRVYRNTLAELQALTPRELADLGLHHSMLRGIAKEAALNS